MTNQASDSPGQACRFCGCREFSACSYISDYGRVNCHWVKPNLCSAPRCLERAFLAAVAEGACVAAVLLGALAALRLPADHWPLRIGCTIAAILAASWWSALREHRLRGTAASIPLGARADWLFWGTLLALLALGTIGMQTAVNRLPAALRRANAISMPLPAPAPQPEVRPAPAAQPEARQ